MISKNQEERNKSEMEAVRELGKYYGLLVREKGPNKEVFRQIAGAILDGINNWCGNFVPEYNEIIITIGKALIDEIDYITPGEAYYAGDYLMTVIMSSEDMDDAKAKLYDIITRDRLHTGLQLHIAGLIDISK